MEFALCLLSLSVEGPQNKTNNGYNINFIEVIKKTSSKTLGQSVGLGETARRTAFSSKIKGEQTNLLQLNAYNGTLVVLNNHRLR